MRLVGGREEGLGAERARDPQGRLAAAAAVAGGCARARGVGAGEAGGGRAAGPPPPPQLSSLRLPAVGGGWRPLRPLPSGARALAALPRLGPHGRPAQPGRFQGGGGGGDVPLPWCGGTKAAWEPSGLQYGLLGPRCGDGGWSCVKPWRRGLLS